MLGSSWNLCNGRENPDLHLIGVHLSQSELLLNFLPYVVAQCLGSCVNNTARQSCVSICFQVIEKHLVVVTCSVRRVHMAILVVKVPSENK